MIKKYEHYKDSGVEWMGDIPEHWEVRKLKYLAKIKNGMDYKHIETVETGENGYPVMGSGGQFAYAEKYLFSGESVLLGRKGTIDKPNYVNGKYWIVDTSFYTKVFSFVSVKYFYYCCLSLINYDLFATNTALPSMTQEDLNNIYLLYPSITEQQAIATYLDKKSQAIDQFIKNKESLISLLEEEKKAIITKAVTKGLDKNVKLKDSGVEWLGEIPEHWEVRKLKYLGNFKSGESITSEKINYSGCYPVFGGNGLRGYTSSYTHDGSYILIGRQGALCGNVNYVDGKIFASEHAVVITTNNNINYIGELLKIMNLNQYSQSAAQPGLAVDTIKNIFTVVPILSEQQAIATHLDEQIKKIDDLKAKYRQEIDLIKEYKERLIYDVVTGKINVMQE